MRRDSALPNPTSVSVVITSYNYGRYLAAAVQSVLEQSQPVEQLIIIDDGSTDDSRDIARGLIESHPSSPIELICQPNSGCPAAARNTAIARVASEYVVSLDADDILPPDYLHACASALHAHPRAGITYGDIQRFGDENSLGVPPEWNSRVELDGNFIGSASMFRQQAWEEVGGYDTNMAMVGYEDWDFWVCCVEHGWEGIKAPGAMWYYRVHEGGVFATNVPRDQVLKAQIVQKHPTLYNREQRLWAAGVLAGDPKARATGTIATKMPTTYGPPSLRPRRRVPHPIKSMCLVTSEYPGSVRLSPENPAPVCDGVGRIVRMHAETLRAAGIDVHVITKSTGGRSGMYEDTGVFVHELHDAKLEMPDALAYLELPVWSYLASTAFARLDAAIGFDIVETHAGGHVLHLTPRIETPLVAWMHTMMPAMTDGTNGRARTVQVDLLRAMDMTALERADLLIACSQLALDEVARYLGDRLPPAQLMPLSFDPESFPARNHTRRAGPLRALFFGRLDADTGSELALHAVAAARARGVQAELTVAGHDSQGYRERILAPLQAELRLNDVVAYLPHTDDLYGLRRLLANADIAILPSRAGYSPGTIFEALSSGVPVIASDRIVTAEFTVAGSGLLSLPVDDPSEFGRRAAEAIADPNWIATGPRAAACIRDRFAPERAAADILDCYTQLRAARAADVARAPAPPTDATALDAETVAPLDATRSVAVLAFAEELIADPSLLQAWAETFDGNDDVTLVIHAPNWSPGDVERKLLPVVEAAGLDSDDAADLLAIPTQASPEADARLVAGCRAILSRRRPSARFDALKIFDDVSIGSLRTSLRRDVARKTTRAACRAPVSR